MESQEIRLECLRWPIIRDLMNRGYQNVIFAVGAVEQHGPHLPLGTDALVGDALAVLVAQRLGNTLVAPTVRVGCSSNHMGFPGTLTVQPQTLGALIEDYVMSLAHHGFRRVVVQNTHGGNIGVLRLVARALQQRLQGVLVIPVFSHTNPYGREERAVGPAEGYHANRIETAWLLHIMPDLVEMAAAVDEAGAFDPLLQEPLIALNQFPMDNLTTSGLLGRATLATARDGKASLEAIAGRIVQDVEAVTRMWRAWHPGTQRQDERHAGV